MAKPPLRQSAWQVSLSVSWLLPGCLVGPYNKSVLSRCAWHERTLVALTLKVVF